MTSKYKYDGLRFNRSRSTGIYLDGRPVRLFLRCGRFTLGGWYIHLEVGSRVFRLTYGTWWLENLMLQVVHTVDRIIEQQSHNV